jgi:hypothetical protein
MGNSLKKRREELLLERYGVGVAFGLGRWGMGICMHLGSIKRGVGGHVLCLVHARSMGLDSEF